MGGGGASGGGVRPEALRRAERGSRAWQRRGAALAPRSSVAASMPRGRSLPQLAEPPAALAGSSLASCATANRAVDLDDVRHRLHGFGDLVVYNFQESKTVFFVPEYVGVPTCSIFREFSAFIYLALQHLRYIQTTSCWNRALYSS
jgi:hypothetical protein